MTTSVKVQGHYVVVRGTVLKVARLEQEWFEDLDDPEQMAAALSTTSPRADILSFWQRLPNVEPQYRYHTEWEEIAALPISSYDHWWSNQIKSRTRGLIRKSEKQGVTVREVEFTDDFVRGITRIFNETRMRQGRPFWHYGKDFNRIKSEFSRYLFRERLIGAYVGDELIGFMMIGFAGKYAVTGQIISMIKHRDKAPTNCLVAKAVEICAREKMPYLVYLHWGTGSFAEFKRRTGFEKTRVPRYFVPLTAKGRLALRLGVHNGVVPLLPGNVLARLKQLRAMWYRGVYSLYDRRALAREGDF
jgi:hypothetical protein